MCLIYWKAAVNNNNQFSPVRKCIKGFYINVVVVLHLSNGAHPQLIMSVLHKLFISHAVEQVELDTCLGGTKYFFICLVVFFYVVIRLHMLLWSTFWLRVVSYLVSVRASLPAAWEQSSSPADFMSHPSKSIRISILMLAPFHLMNMVSNWVRSVWLLFIVFDVSSADCEVESCSWLFD